VQKVAGRVCGSGGGGVGVVGVVVGAQAWEFTIHNQTLELFKRRSAAC